MIVRITAKDGYYEFDDTDELWQPISECPDHYQISNMGRCRSLDRITLWGNREIFIKGRILCAKHRKGLYSSYILSVNNVHMTRQIHTLVASHFIPNPENKETVNHKFGRRFDNRASELEWNTNSENNLHGHDIGLFHTRKIAASAVMEIRSSPLSDIKLAQIYGVRPGNIWNIRNRKSWKHI